MFYFYLWFFNHNFFFEAKIKLSIKIAGKVEILKSGSRVVDSMRGNSITITTLGKESGQWGGWILPSLTILQR